MTCGTWQQENGSESISRGGAPFLSHPMNALLGGDLRSLEAKPMPWALCHVPWITLDLVFQVWQGTLSCWGCPTIGEYTWSSVMFMWVVHVTSTLMPGPKVFQQTTEL